MLINLHLCLPLKGGNQMSNKRIGYKMTELGEIPSEWEVSSLGDLTIEHKQGYYTKQSYVDEGVKLIRITDLSNPKINYKNMPMLNISQSDYESYKVDVNDFLFARSGAIGRYGIVQKNIPAVFASYLIRFKFNKEKSVNEFIGYYYESDFIQGQIKKITQGSSNININANNIKSLKISLPPLKEQQKIASILSTVDEQIDETEQLIVKTKELKKGLMQQLLTKGIGHTEFKQTELGEIPVDWKVRALEKVCYFSNGKAHEEFVDENGEYILINSKFISTEGKVAKNASEMLMPLEENDITIVMSDVPNGKAFSKCFLVPESDKYTLNQRIGLIRTDSMYSKFLFYQVNRNSYFLSFDNGVGQTNLRKADLLACPILVPSFEEQQKIAQILSTVDEQIEAYEEEKAKYEELKKGLMQKLLTGQIRVKV